MTHADGAKAGSIGGTTVGADAIDPRACQELWHTLARREWRSIVLVPAETGVPTEQLALGLAQVGQQLGAGPVTAVTPSALEYATAAALADMPSFVGGRRLPGRTGWTTVDLAPSEVREIQVGSEEAEAVADVQPDAQSVVLASTARLIISVPAVVDQPLGLAATQTADLVVVCVERGRTRLSSVERTVRLIGRERVLGCVLLG